MFAGIFSKVFPEFLLKFLQICKRQRRVIWMIWRHMDCILNNQNSKMCIIFFWNFASSLSVWVWKPKFVLEFILRLIHNILALFCIKDFCGMYTWDLGFPVISSVIFSQCSSFDFIKSLCQKLLQCVYSKILRHYYRDISLDFIRSSFRKFC